ncbi:hypothetical protein A3H19_05405 [Candidatus Woesebacteria bacterium RIFCSPLOWO2_12_FULL_39_9]|nr:MAG: hypothetical protein A3H19_05405 [Candidatus Woesebacteria bacterium RIFCSPLOWO2_12_FULL_39_9]
MIVNGWVLLILLIASFASGVLGAYFLHAPVLGYVYDRMRPKGYSVTTEPGERIEGILPIDFWSTTFLWLLSVVNRFLLIDGLLILLYNIMSTEISKTLFYWVIFLGIIGQAVVNVTWLPFSILRTDWRLRIRIRIIATTREIVSYALDFNPAALFTGNAPDVLVSHSDMRTARNELRWATNPQKLNSDFKLAPDPITSWIAREVIIPLRASLGKYWSGGVRSFSLLTFYQTASDQIALVEWGSLLIEIIDKCSDRAVKLFARKMNLVSQEVTAEIGKPGEEFDPTTTQDQLADIEYRRHTTLWPAKKYDPFQEPDPGYWSMQTGEELVNYNVGVTTGQPVYVGR